MTDITTEGLTLRTRGLGDQIGGQADIRVPLEHPDLMEEGRAFLDHVAQYLLANPGTRLRPGETLAYGYWLTQFNQSNDGVLEVWEYEPNAVHFVPGANLTLTYWKEQHAECEAAGARFLPPRPDRLAAISRGVLEGDAVEGIRYPSPEHMSGWWLITEQYMGDIKTLTSEHLYHVTAARPDLARFMALPYGYRFDQRYDPPVRFDKEIATQDP